LPILSNCELKVARSDFGDQVCRHIKSYLINEVAPDRQEEYYTEMVKLLFFEACKFCKMFNETHFNLIMDKEI
jgi:hypothetical protein